MSLIARVSYQLPYASSIVKQIGVSINFAQPANSMLKYVEEGVEIDPRLLPTDYNPVTFDPTNHRRPPTKRVWRLVDTVAGLTLAEAAELSDIMFNKFCYRLMKRLSMKERLEVMAGAAKETETAAGKEEKKAEKTVFELVIQSYEAASKLKVIKEIRTFADLGLKEAKELVEKAPAILKKGVSKKEGEDIIEKMKALGAKVVMV